MKKGGLLCCLLVVAASSFGQGRDTVLAVHKLFKQRRGGGDAWVEAGYQSAVDEKAGWRAIRSSAENTRAAVFNGGIPVVVGLVQGQRFSVEREASIIKRYEQGWAIPADIRRKLRRKHFHRTATDISGR